MNGIFIVLLVIPSLASACCSSNAPVCATGCRRDAGMAIWVVAFSNGGYKFRKKKFLKINILKEKLFNSENWVNKEVSKSAKI